MESNQILTLLLSDVIRMIKQGLLQLFWLEDSWTMWGDAQIWENLMKNIFWDTHPSTQFLGSSRANVNYFICPISIWVTTESTIYL